MRPKVLKHFHIAKITENSYNVISSVGLNHQTIIYQHVIYSETLY